MDETIGDIVARTDKMKNYSYFVSVSIAWCLFGRRDCDDIPVLVGTTRVHLAVLNMALHFCGNLYYLSVGYSPWL